MDFELTREQVMIRDNVREFMDKEIGPVCQQMDEEDRFPEDLFPQMGSLGYLGLSLPVEYGGEGLEFFASILAAEQMGRVSPAVGLSYCAHANLCAHNIARNGNEEQKRKFLPGLCAGTLVGCMGLTEPGAGSDAVGISTTAVKDGKHYLLNGSKTFITNAPIADVALVYAKTSPEKKSRGITAFLVEKGTPGFSVSRRIEKIGHHGSPTGELVFMDARVPEENVLGRVDQGVRVMMNGLDSERIIVAALCLGIGLAALELALSYSRKREQFGRPICEFQLTKAKLADMYTENEAARGLIYRAASLAEKSGEGGKGTELHKLAAAAILYTAEATSRATANSVQIHGGYGYTTEYPINRFYRDSKLYEIGAGTSEVRRLLIADELIRRGIGGRQA
ncbi:MAG: acyl-CoA dehydrogenase family protein [Thermodesulfobacteriota bacterium]